MVVLNLIYFVFIFHSKWIQIGSICYKTNLKLSKQFLSNFHKQTLSSQQKYFSHQFSKMLTAVRVHYNVLQIIAICNCFLHVVPNADLGHISSKIWSKWLEPFEFLNSWYISNFWTTIWVWIFEDSENTFFLSRLDFVYGYSMWES